MLALRLRDAQMQNCAMHERTRLTHKCGDETDNLERNGNERRHTSMHYYAQRNGYGKRRWVQHDNDHIHIGH